MNGSLPSSNWKVVEVKDEQASGLYGCIIETDEDKAIIGFRGSENPAVPEHLFKDWILADAALLNNANETGQQQQAKNFVESFAHNPINNKYTSLALTGHSLGGNLASYVTLACDGTTFSRITQGVNLDGPGFSTEFISNNGWSIMQRADVITHYQWSAVGNLLIQVPGSNYYTIEINDKFPDTGDVGELFTKHDLAFVLLENNMFITGTIRF